VNLFSEWPRKAPEMIRLAQECSRGQTNLEFLGTDVLTCRNE